MSLKMQPLRPMPPEIAAWGANHQSDYAPQQFRQPIMDAIQQSTGQRVTSR
jgi:hypothetical protein